MKSSHFQFFRNFLSIYKFLGTVSLNLREVFKILTSVFMKFSAFTEMMAKFDQKWPQFSENELSISEKCPKQDCYSLADWEIGRNWAKIAETEIATFSEKIFKPKLGTKRANFNQNWHFWCIFSHEMRYFWSFQWF